MRFLPLVTAFSLISAAFAFAAPAVQTVETGNGKVIAADNGMTLYTYKKDEKGESYCYDKCATNWPPYLAEGSAAADGDYTLVERKDGKKQWALKGMPLYFFVKDTKTGDATGDGVGKVWDAARP
jgi:predicted lipoprotein with Yx(FWY)xxD motif